MENNYSFSLYLNLGNQLDFNFFKCFEFMMSNDVQRQLLGENSEMLITESIYSVKLS